MARGLIAKGARKCHVYLVCDPDEHVKVGRSSRLDTRLAELATGRAGGVRLVHSWKLKMADAISLESRMHKALRHFRVSGEWFRIEACDAQGVGNVLLAGGDDAAARLVEVLVEADVMMSEIESLSRHAREMTNFQAAKRRELRAREWELLEQHDSLRKRALSLGTLPTPLEQARIDQDAAPPRDTRPTAEWRRDYQARMALARGLA